MTELCPCGADLRGACLDCLTGPPEPTPAPPPAPAVERVGSSWPARYDGHCSGCNLAIHVNQPVCCMTDGTYQHDDCAGPPP